MYGSVRGFGDDDPGTGVRVDEGSEGVSRYDLKGSRSVLWTKERRFCNVHVED